MPFKDKTALIDYCFFDFEKHSIFNITELNASLFL